MKDPIDERMARVESVAFAMGRLDAPFAVRSEVLEVLGLDEAAIAESNAQVCKLLRAPEHAGLREAYRHAFARGREGADGPEANSSPEGLSEPKRGAYFLGEPPAFREEAARVAILTDDESAPALMSAPVERPERPEQAPADMTAPENVGPTPGQIAETRDLPADFVAGMDLPFDRHGEIDFAALARARQERDAAEPPGDASGETVMGARLVIDAPLPFLDSADPRPLVAHGDGAPTEVLSAEDFAPRSRNVEETALPGGSERGPALPFASTAPLHPPPGAHPEPPLSLTLEQYASLCAELIVHRDAPLAAIYARYGLSTAQEGAVAVGRWQARLEGDERLRAAWRERRDAFVSWLRASSRRG